MRTWKDAFLEESARRRKIDPNKICRYGIKPLDDALIGIAPRELVIIGADSGVGKTEIGLQIAQYNANRGKRIALYHLEGGDEEAIARMKWKDISKEYYNGHGTEFLDMDYKKWRLNKIADPKGLLKDLEVKVFETYKEKYEDNLMICPISHSFGLRELLNSTRSFLNFEGDEGKYDLDLIIIDHLQYFSLTQSESEIKEITNILREVKNISNYGIPVILISHLRKKMRDRGLPNQEDFYGSSNIPKISDTSIIIAPHYGQDDAAIGRYPTIFRIVKSRTGVKPNYAIKVDFDLPTRNYAEDYQIYRINSKEGLAEEPLKPFELPKWAKGER